MVKIYKITVIIPSYNVSGFIDRAFQSLYNQTIGFENLEVIFVDDCSTDNTTVKIREYSEKYENVTAYFLDENSGFAGKPRNVGLQYASSEYVMFLDPDDYFLIDACEVLYSKISEQKLDFVSANYCVNDDNNKTSWKHIGIENELFINSIYEKSSLLILPPSIWSKIYKKSFLDNNNILFNEKLPGQDAIFIMEVLLKAKKILYVDIPVSVYCKRDYTNTIEKSITDDRTFKRLSNYLDAYEVMYNLLLNFDENFVIALSGHLSYWTTMLIDSKITGFEKINLISSFEKLFKKVNQHSSNQYELLQLLLPVQTNSFIRLVNTQNDELEKQLLFDSPYLEKYQKMLKELNNKVYSTEKLNITTCDDKNSTIFEDNFNVKISVIIPVYNVEKYLPTCINSILNQSFKEFEIICIDDNSTDSSNQILSYFTHKDNRIKIIKNSTNLGPGYSRNIAITLAKGEYIQFLDSDDWLDQNSLEETYNEAKKYDADVLIYKLINFDDEKEEFFKSEYYSMDNLNIIYDKVMNYKEIGDEIIFNIPNSPCNKIFKKSFLIKNTIYFPESLIHEDNPFFFRTMYESDSIVFKDKYYYNRRRRQNSITTNKDIKLLSTIKIAEIVLNNFIDQNLYDYSKEHLLNYLVSIMIKKYYYIDNESKEKYFNSMKKKIYKFDNEYNLKNDFEEYLTFNNKKYYHLINESENFNDFREKLELKQ